MSEHYAYCRNFSCPGCLPSDDDLASAPLAELWVEMLNRCIPQTPDTKSAAGALAAIVADGHRYRSMARRARSANLAAATGGTDQ